MKSIQVSVEQPKGRPQHHQYEKRWHEARQRVAENGGHGGPGGKEDSGNKYGGTNADAALAQDSTFIIDQQTAGGDGKGVAAYRKAHIKQGKGQEKGLERSIGQPFEESHDPPGPTGDDPV